MKVFQSSKNKAKPVMFDIQPNKHLDGFLVAKNDKKISNNELENHEALLVEALRAQEEIEILKKEKQALIQKEKELEIKKEAAFFRYIQLDQYFSEQDIPTRFVSDWLSENHFSKAKIITSGNKEKLEYKEEFNEEYYQELQIQEESFALEQIKIEKEIIEQKQKEANLRKKIKEESRREKKLVNQKKKAIVNKKRLERKKERGDQIRQIKQNLLAKPGRIKTSFSFLKPVLAFSGACLTIFLVIFSLRFVFYGAQIKDRVIVKGVSVATDLDQAKNNFQDKNFSQIVLDFQNVQQEINGINRDLEKMEGGLPKIISKLPFISRYGSAKNVLEAGNEIAQGMILVSQSADEFSRIENPLSFEKNKQDSSLGDFFLDLEKQLVLAENHFKLAQKNLEEVNPQDLPEEYQKRIVILKNNFPKALALLGEFNQKQVIFKDLLGYNGPRKYLFLFQNNHEIRATGGFIGSYGVLSVHNGNIKELFVDGIFNPDGQLSTRVIPPKPIQKISTNWSTHDANWFPNFPTSAEKISWFYEKTGGPTVDGIITLTPTVMEKLLKVTGPIEMVEYGVTVNSQNFIESIQYEVEENYNKKENKPKKFIADLTPKILDKIFSEEGLSRFPQSLQILSEALNEKHILIYSENSEIQSIVSDLGWSGEVLKSPLDYLMIINSNINGYKTDGVIDQSISHKIKIKDDGSIVDTVTIERSHNGGSSQYEWWNKVNSDYMRVYVPQGSELLEASGYTRETIKSPVNYNKLGFKRDPLVVELEESIRIDQKSGTEIWDEAGKTVFANWVYVSPQEKVQVSYKYRLPFKLDINPEKDKMDTYSVLYQKQSGMNTSALKSILEITDNQSVFWQYPDDLKDKDGFLEYNSNLERDRFVGVVLK